MDNNSPPKKKYKNYSSDSNIPRTTLWRRFRARAENQPLDDVHLQQIDIGLAADDADNNSVQPASPSEPLPSTEEDSQQGEQSNIEVAGDGADNPLHPASPLSSCEVEIEDDDTVFPLHHGASTSSSPLHSGYSEDEEQLMSTQGSEAESHFAEQEISFLSAASSIDEISSEGDEESQDERDDDSPDEADMGILFNDNYLHEPLRVVENCTIGETLLMGLTLANRHHLSDVALKDIMEMCNAVAGHDAVPSTTYRLRKVFREPFNSAQYYVYCIYCGTSQGRVRRDEPEREMECINQRCKKLCKLSLKEGNFFVMLDIRMQIKILFEGNVKISKFMKERQTDNFQSDGFIRGVEDSTLHKTVFEDKTLDRRRDFTYNFHVDGAKMFHTTKHSLYPIQLIVNELPPSIRQGNIVLAGLWYGKGPVLETFLKPFVEQALDLYHRGVTWTVEEGNVVTSKFISLCACADSVQRPTLQNHVQFNGYFGCSWCYNPGKLLPGTKTMKYPYELNNSDRKVLEIMRDMQECIGVKGGINGVLGVSPLIKLPHFNHVWGYAVDYLHQVLIGILAYLLEYALTHSNTAYYLGRPTTLRIIDARLESIKPPYTVPHLPKGFKDKGTWKASDYKAWLLWYAIPCLHDVWRQPYLEHFACLVEGITLLLQQEISPADLAKAGELLDTFVKDLDKLYGPAALTYNAHSLLHYAKSVEMCGPLWTNSTFPYESNMYKYKCNVTGSKGVPLQITERVIRSTFLPALKQVVNPSENVDNFINKTSMLSRRYPDQKCRDINGSLLVGTGSFRALTVRETNVLNVKEACEYNKVIHSGLVLTSTKYRRSDKRCSNIIKLQNGGFGVLEGIFLIDAEYEEPHCKFLVKILHCQRFCVGNVQLSHVWKCTDRPTETLVAVKPTEVLGICIFISFHAARTKKFLVELANLVEGD